MNAGPAPRPNRGRLRTLEPWLVPALIALACLLLATGGQALRHLGRYERERVLSGELWRLLSGHFVHLSWPHLWMNLAALGLLGLLLDRAMTSLDWSVATLASIICIDIGLLWLDPDVVWYVGLSGVLHGLLAFGAWRLLAMRSPVGWLLAAGLVVKLAWEHWLGPVPLSAETAGGEVVVSAHLYGAVGGSLAVWACRAFRRRRGARL